MIKEATRGCNQEVHTLRKFVHLSSSVGPTHNDAKGLRVVGHQLFRYAKNLQRKLSCRRNNDNAGACCVITYQSMESGDDTVRTVPWLELHSMQELDCWYKERKGLSAAGLRRAENIFAS